MKKILLSTLAVSVSMAMSQMALASMIDDTKVTVESKTAYTNSDDRSGGYDSKEAAQGFLLDIESGFTAGDVGFGIDAFAGFGMKLDGSVKKDGAGNRLPQTGLLPDSQKEYSKVGLTAKMKYGESLLKVGSLRPEMPILMHNKDHLMPQIFQGVAVEFNEIENLTVQAGQIYKVNHINSQDYEKMTVDGLGVDQTTNKFSYIGGTYQVSDQLAGSYYYSGLKDFYKQHFLGATYDMEVGGGLAGVDLRYFTTRDDGGGKTTTTTDWIYQECVGCSVADMFTRIDTVTTNRDKIDNKTFSGMVNYGIQGHKVGLAYQKSSGSNGFLKMAGTDSYLHNDSQISDFAHKGEKSWQVRYDLDFAEYGVEGLTFMTNYVKGTGVDRGVAGSGKEWERNTDIAYKFQSGAAKDLSVTMRNATHRSNFAGDTDEVRLVVSYPFSM